MVAVLVVEAGTAAPLTLRVGLRLGIPFDVPMVVPAMARGLDNRQRHETKRYPCKHASTAARFGRLHRGRDKARREDQGQKRLEDRASISALVRGSGRRRNVTFLGRVDPPVPVSDRPVGKGAPIGAVPETAPDDRIGQIVEGEVRGCADSLCATHAASRLMTTSSPSVS